MNDISKILKELSNLTSSLNDLSKEVGKSNSITKETNKDLSSLVKETKDKSPEKNEAKPGEGKNLKNFSESITNILDKQKEGFLKDLEKNNKSIFSDVEKLKIKPAEVENKDAGSDKSGQITKDLIKSVVGRFADIPKLESGGKIKGDGVALVGEKGPELVELKKGNNVNSQDKMSELLKMEMDDMKRSQEKRAKAAENPVVDASKIVTEAPKLDETVTNSFGVKVPKSEIDSYRKEISEDPGMDSSSIEEEVKSFIEDYRETLSVSDVQKLSEKNPKKEIKSSEEKVEASKKDKSESKNLKSSLKKINPKFQKGKEVLKEKANQIFEKTALGSTIKGIKGNYDDVDKEKTGDSTSSSVQESPENLSSKSKTEKNEEGVKSKIEKIGSELKSKIKSKKKESPAKEKSETSPKMESSIPSNVASKENESKTSEKTSETKSENKKKESGNENSSEISSKDIADIKSLLSSINAALNSPLNIKDNKPYRPHSNMLG
jgi:hypothetical protein